MNLTPIIMNSKSFSEEGLLIDMEISEVALKISKLTFGWNNHSEPIKEAHKLLNAVRKLSLNISEYEQRIGPNLSEYQRNNIYNSMDDLEKLIPYMKNKIGVSERLENVFVKED